MENNKWKAIWEKRKPNYERLASDDPAQVFLELKRIDGFDVLPSTSAEPWRKQHIEIRQNLERYHTISSVFDVGCGCGANLYLFQQEGLVVGGLDYSETQIRILKQALPQVPKECLCGGADTLPTEIKYDAVIANSVFSYFPDCDYAERVLTKMLDKAIDCIGLIDIHDASKKEAFLAYRRRIIADYDERYRDLPKLFYERGFFEQIASRYNSEITFCPSHVEGYWNNNYIYNCFIYKRT